MARKRVIKIASSLMDPKHNIREVCKHLVLLEDHLNCASKRCMDCITKHLLAAEAYADEGVSLDTDGIYRASLSGTPDILRSIQGVGNGLMSEKNAFTASGILRALRKKLQGCLCD